MAGAITRAAGAEAVARMITEIESYSAGSPRSVILMDVDLAMVQAWRDSLEVS